VRRVVVVVGGGGAVSVAMITRSEGGVSMVVVQLLARVPNESRPIVARMICILIFMTLCSG